MTTVGAVAIDYPVLRISAQNSATPGLGTTSPDGISVTIQRETFSVRQGLNGFIAGPVVQGVSGAVTWHLAEGTLPTGMTFNGANGVISGVPTTVGVWSEIVISVTDAGGRMGATAPFSVEVIGSPTVAYENSLLSVSQRATILPATVGVFGTPRYTLTGALPAGLTFDKNTGKIFGTPLVTAIRTGLTVTVKDSDGSQGVSAPFSIEVVRGGTIAVPTPLELKVGVAASIQPVASDMNAPLTWKLTDGVALPPGLTLDPASGHISGVPTTDGAYVDLQVRASDVDNKPAASNLFRIQVVTFGLSYDFDGAYSRNEPISVAPQLTHGTAPASYSVYAGDLPAGLILDPVTGVLSGSIAERGTYPAVVIEAVDGVGAVAHSVPITLVIRAPELFYASSETTAGASFSLDPVLTDIDGPTYSIAQGALPDGLSLDTGTGRISGSPGEVGEFNLVIAALDSDANEIESNPFKITIAAPDLSVSNPNSRGRIGIPFYLATDVSGLAAPMVWSVEAGTLPFGLALDPESGLISGTPFEAGMFGGVVLSVEDANGAAGSTPPFSIEIVEPIITYDTPTVVSQGGSVSLTPFTVDLVGQTTFVMGAGQLPDGLTLDPDTGSISGLASEAGNFNGLQVLVVDEGGAFSSNTFTINVTAAGLPAVEPVSDLALRLNVYFAGEAPTVSVFSDPTWTLASGTLPNGLVLDPDTGVISGTPTQTGTWSNLRLRASQGGVGANSNGFTITVTTLSIGVQGSYFGRVEQPFAAYPVAYHAIGSVSWSLDSGSLPPGLSLNTGTGQIAGTPTQVGAWPGIRLRGQDSSGSVATSADFQIDIGEPIGEVGGLFIDVPVMLRGRIAVDFQLDLEAVHAVGNVLWEVASGSLPDGLELDDETGLIDGRPTVVGYFPGIVIRAVDANGVFGISEPFAIDVRKVPDVFVSPLTYQGLTGETLTITPTTDEIWGSQAWDIVGDEPYGLRINPLTGVLSGKVEQTGVFDDIRLQVTDADGAVGQSSPITITVTSLLVPEPGGAGVSGNFGGDYKGRVSRALATYRPALSGAQGDIEFSLAEGTLPSGLALNAETGVIYGTPVAVGYTDGIRLRARDPVSGSSLVSAPITFNISGALAAEVDTSVTGRVGSPLSVAPIARNLIGAASWDVDGVGLPQGLSIKPSTGVVSITPSASATYSGAVLTVIDAFDGSTAQTPPVTFDIWEKLQAFNPVVIPFGTVGQPYSMGAPSTTGAHGPVNWSLKGNLPEGLSLNPSTGTVTGTPLENGSFNLTFVATDSADGAKATAAQFTIAVAPGDPEEPGNVPLQVQYSPGSVYIGHSFSMPPRVLGADSTEVTYEVAPGSALPAWANLDLSTGVITGTPTTGATAATFVVAAHSGAEQALSEPLTLSPLAIAVSANGTASGRVGLPFVFAPSVQNAVGSVTWSRVSGTLPAGLVLNTATGRISGTPTSIAKDTPIVLRATDSVGRTAATAPILLTISPVVSQVGATFSGLINEPFTTTVRTLVGATGPVQWTLVSGALPSWATLNPSTGSISGTPTVTGTYSGLSLMGTHAETGLSANSATFSIKITRRDLMVSGLGGTYRARIGASLVVPTPSVTGATGPVIWSVASGTVPAWLTLNTSSGAISGMTSEVGGASNIALRATDTASGATDTSESFGVQVVGNPVASRGNGQAKVGTHAIFVPQASNILGTGAWSLASGTLPSWASIDPATGAISGTPGHAHVGMITGLRLRVVDSHDGASATTEPFDIEVAPLIMVSGGPSGQYVTHPGTAVALPTPTVNGATGAVTWSLVGGTLPFGVSIDAATGRIAGSPLSAGGTSSLRLMVTDVSSGISVTSPASFQINAVELSAVASPNYFGQVTRSFQVTPTVANAIGSTSWSIATGTLPAWANFNEATGRISGVPNLSGMTSGLSLKVTDALGATAVTSNFSIDIERGFDVTLSPTSYSGRVGVSLSTAAPHVENSTGAISWSVLSGSLPDGLSLNPSTGVITGAPTEAGTFSGLVLSALDNGDGSTGQTPALSFTITDVPSIGVQSSYSVRVGAPASFVPAVSDASGSQAWSLAAGSVLPPWASLHAGTGVISGTATAIGTYPDIGLRVQDGQGAVGTSAAFTIEVTPGITASIADTGYQGRKGFFIQSEAPAAGNSLGSVSWSLGGGSIPAGMAINPSTGVISGTPVVNGTYVLYLQARDSYDGATALTAPITVTLSNSLQVTGEKATYGTHINTPIATSALGVIGASGSVQWSLVSGALPGWASLNTTTGVISGTPTTVSTVSGLQLRATDLGDGATADTGTFSIQVLGAITVSNMATNYTARLSQPFFTAPLSASNIGGTATYSIGQGTLPSWASINPSTGSIQGTPPTKTTTSGLRFKVQDEWNGTYTSPSFFNITVQSPPTADWNTAVYKARVGTAVDIQTRTTNIVTPAWSIYSGGVPGVTLGNPAVGRLQGTPTTPGDYTVNLMVTDQADGAYVLLGDYPLSVKPALVPADSPTTVSLRTGKYYESSPLTVAGLGGTATWAHGTAPSGGALPVGLTVNPSTGVISGIPTAAGSPTWGRLQVTDSWDGLRAYQVGYTTFTIKPGVTAPANATNLVVPIGQPISSWTPTVFNAVGSLTWTHAGGPLPAGVSIDPGTGRVVGTPTQLGTFEGISVRATDSEGSTSLSNAFKIVVQETAPTAAAGFAVMTASGTFNPPAGVTEVRVLVMGAGGNGWAPQVASGGYIPGDMVGGKAGKIAVGTFTISGPVSVTVGRRIFPSAPADRLSSFGNYLSASGGSDLDGGTSTALYTGTLGTRKPVATRPIAGDLQGNWDEMIATIQRVRILKQESGASGSGTAVMSGSTITSIAATGGGGGIYVVGYSPAFGASNGGGPANYFGSGGVGFGAGGGGAAKYGGQYYGIGQGATGVVVIEWDAQ